jgi:hypothetical protein
MAPPRASERERKNEHGDGGVEDEAKPANPDHTGEVAAASLECDISDVPRSGAERDDSHREKASLTLKDPFWVRGGV